MKAERRIGIVVVIQRLRSAVRRLQAELPIVAQRARGELHPLQRKVTKVLRIDRAPVTALEERAS